MTKIYMYGVSEAERPFIQHWQEQHPDVEITTDEDILEEDTAARAEGYDGVTSYQYKRVADPVYAKFQDYGIHNIAQRMAGYDPYNLELAKESGIIITNVPSYSPESIAEYAVAQMLNGLRHLYRIYLRSRRYDFREGSLVRGSRLGNMTVGVIGTGRIGRHVAHMVHDGFGSQVLGYDVYQNEEIKSILEYKDTVEELVENSDVITLHLPLLPDTRHIVNDDLFSHFKDGTVLVNAGRGALIDTQALIRALDSGKVGFAAIDTYENEFDYAKHDFSNRGVKDRVLVNLIQRDNVSYTPHLAYYTDESVRNIVMSALDSTLNIIQTGDDDKRVN